MDAVVAIDQGTQSSRAFVYDSLARPIASHQVEFAQIYPRSGWCEHDPQVLLSTVQLCVQKAVEAAKSKHPDLRIKAVGITNQRETTLIWRRSTGKPCHNAIVWLDNRTRDICHAMTNDHGSLRFQNITGLTISTYFSAFKVKWLADNVQDVRDAMASGDAMVGTVDSWLIYCLTGGRDGGIHVTDVTNASRTCLMDIRTLQWSQECLDVFGITADMLPRICCNSEIYGHVKEGPLAGVPIAGCLGDQQAATLGQRCVQGQGKNTYGTGCFLLVHTGSDIIMSKHGLLTTVAYQLGKDSKATYALEGSIAIAGMGVSWLRDQLGLIKSASESEVLARTVENTGGVYFVPAFGGLLAPHWRDDARGVIVGISGFTNKCHIVRAVLEAIAFQTRDVIEAVQEDTGFVLDKLRVDGGASKNNLLMQIQADVLQGKVERPAFQETTSLGAAFAAGLAVGFYTHEQIFTPPTEEATVFVPAASKDNATERYASWKLAVQRSVALDQLC